MTHFTIAELVELQDLVINESPDDSEVGSPPTTPLSSLSPRHSQQKEDYLYLLHQQEAASWATSSTVERYTALPSGYGSLEQVQVHPTSPVRGGARDSRHQDEAAKPVAKPAAKQKP